MPVVADIIEAEHASLAVGQPVGMNLTATIESATIFVANDLCPSVGCLADQLVGQFGYPIKDGLAVYLMSQYPTKRHGVWGIAAEHLLVDVDAGADDAGLDVLCFERCLNECAAELAVAPIDVVGPLHANVIYIL